MKVLANMARSKVQLYIGYFLILCVLVLGSVATYGYIEQLRLANTVTSLEGRVHDAEQEVTAVKAENVRLGEVVDTVRTIRSVDGEILAGLVQDVQALRVRDTSVNTRIATLEKTNEQVKQYLAAAVPEPLGCVLDKTCAPTAPGGGAGAAAGSPAPAVPAPAAGAHQDQRGARKQ